MNYHTTMIADSRVRYLQEELSRLSGLHIPVISKSGTDFAAIDREFNLLTHWNKISALYILTGVNETTWTCISLWAEGTYHIPEVGVLTEAKDDK